MQPLLQVFWKGKWWTLAKVTYVPNAGEEEQDTYDMIADAVEAYTGHPARIASTAPGVAPPKSPLEALKKFFGPRRR